MRVNKKRGRMVCWRRHSKIKALSELEATEEPKKGESSHKYLGAGPASARSKTNVGMLDSDHHQLTDPFVLANTGKSREH